MTVPPAVDFGRHSDDYAAFRPGPPGSFYERLEEVIPIRGSRALDLATGPGTIALELATRGSTVTGIDISARQVAVAKRVAKERGLSQAAGFHVARAEETGLDSDSVDLVTAGQSWHWFDRDAVVAEIRRVLRADGILAIVHYSYLPDVSEVARETESLVLEFNPSWTFAGSTGVYPREIDDVVRGGLTFVEAFRYDHDEPFSHARWRGRMRTCNGVGSGGLPPAEVVRFDEALGHLLKQKFQDPMVVRHRVWCVMARKARST